MSNTKWTRTTLAALVGLSSVAFAQEEELSLSALLNLTSSVASKIEQPIQDAPGVITVYTKRDLKDFGYFTLAELADITPGYSSTNRFAEKGFETRGQGTDGWNNNKHLLLIDGIPIRHVRANRAMIEENMPVNNAKRVEFLKGPASALYGVGAFSGVINVVTDEPEDEGVISQVRMFAGTQNQTTGMNGFVAAKSENGTSKANVGYYRKLASNTPIEGNNLRPYQDDNKSIFFSASHGLTEGLLSGLSVGFIYSQKEGGIGEYWGAETHEFNRIIWTTAIPYIKYSKEINDQLSINSYLSGTHSVENGMWFGDPRNSGTEQSNGEWNEALRSIDYVAETRYNLSDESNIIAGFNYYQNGGIGNSDGTYNWSLSQNDGFGVDEGFNEEKDLSKTYSGYLQYSDLFPFLEGTLLTLGLREDYFTYKDESFEQLSPRAAVVQKLTDEVNLKLLYGTALKAPGQKEYNLNNESQNKINTQTASSNLVVHKNASKLGAETVQSLEGGITYNTNRIVSSLSGFYNITSNLISTTTLATDTVQKSDLNAWENTSGEVKAYGLEADIQFLISKELRILSNYAIARAEDAAGEPFGGVPLHKINSGVNFNLEAEYPLSITLMNKWISGYTLLKDGKETTDIDGTNVLDAYVSLGIGENFSLNLQAKNIIDGDQEKPSDNGGVLVPVSPREFLIGFTTQF